MRGRPGSRLRGEPDAIRLQVSDSGVGFAPASLERSEGLGLVSMRERLDLLGGEISIQSQLWQGTRIDVRCPLSNTPSGQG